jgi:20S proteasome subunit beta 2
VLGGFDVTGPQLYTIAPHGSTDKLPYVTMGSGSLAAMAVFESRWSAKMSRSDAIALVVDAIESGIFNDLGSGSNVDVCVLEKGRNEMLRNYVRPNERVEKELSYRFRKGTTAVKRIQVKQFVIAEEVVKLLEPATSGTASGATAPAAAAASEMQVDA